MQNERPIHASQHHFHHLVIQLGCRNVPHGMVTLVSKCPDVTLMLGAVAPMLTESCGKGTCEFGKRRNFFFNSAIFGCAFGPNGLDSAWALLSPQFATPVISRLLGVEILSLGTNILLCDSTLKTKDC